MSRSTCFCSLNLVILYKDNFPISYPLRMVALYKLCRVLNDKSNFLFIPKPLNGISVSETSSGQILPSIL